MTYVAVWVALLLLLAASFGFAQLPLGALGPVVAMAIAAAKTALVALFFMHLERSAPLVRLAAVVGLVFLGILFTLALADYLTRGRF